MGRCVKAMMCESVGPFGSLSSEERLWSPFGQFIEESGFEKPGAEEQSDGDAHHVEADIADGAVTAGNVQLVNLVENADDPGDRSRSKETDRQTRRAFGPWLNRSVFEPSRQGRD